MGETPATAILQGHLGMQFKHAADISAKMDQSGQSHPFHKQSPRAFGLTRDPFAFV